MVWVMGWVEKMGRVTDQSFFASTKKSGFGLGILKVKLGWVNKF